MRNSVDLSVTPLAALKVADPVAAKFRDMAGAAARGLVWIGSWCGAMSGVSCQFRIGGSVQFPPVTRIKSLRTPNKSGFWPEVDGGLGLAKSRV